MPSSEIVNSRALRSILRLLRFARQELGAVFALGVIWGGIAAFVDIADDMTEADGQALDQQILDFVRPGPEAGDPIGPHWLETAMLDITALGGLSVLLLFALIATGVLLIQKKPWSALMLAVSLAGGLLLSEVTKGLFERDRPSEIYRTVETINASFPSGHALLSTVFYLTLGVMLERAFARRRMKIYILGAAVLVALLVGVSRVYLAAHWATDVMGGWALGAAWAMVCWLVAYVVQRQALKRGLGAEEPA
jgi:undecaprenyl-diphosphatase